MNELHAVLLTFWIAGIAMCVGGILLFRFIPHRAVRWLGGALVVIGALWTLLLSIILISDGRIR